MKRFLFLFLYSEYKNNKIMTTILFPDILHYMLNDSDNYVASMTSSLFFKDSVRFALVNFSSSLSIARSRCSSTLKFQDLL